jgi:hypothetical protein
MTHRCRAALAATVLALGLAGPLACRTLKPTRPAVEPPPPGFEPNVIDYVDSDGFDSLFETALVNQDPVILIRTEHEKPDWGGRLTAWIAAWNMGGKVGPNTRRARGQAPLPFTVDGDTVREFRLLVESLMDRAEDLAGKESAWWKEERTRSRRVALLGPYNLRFHLDADHHIQLIFFNGAYSQRYPEFMQTARAETDEPGAWVRGYSCSWCRQGKD